MATTQLSDVIVPEVYADYQAVNTLEKTAFYQSGAVVQNPLLDQKANTGGKKIDVPFWKDLDSSQTPNLSSDNPASSATPQKVTAGEQIAQIAYLNQGYSSADLAAEIAGSDPMQRVRNRFGTYWQRQFQRRLIGASEGILADNVANDSGDMVNDVAAEAVASQTAATKFSQDAFIETAYTMGDAADGLSALVVHSAIAKQITKLNDAEDVRDSEGNLLYRVYMGHRIIVDDGMTVTAGTTDGFKYTSILVGSGAFGYGSGTPRTPVELDRDAAAGDGGGIEALWERVTWLLHPFGFAVAGTPAKESYSLTELATATSWNRVVDRKNVPLAFLVTN